MSETSNQESIFALRAVYLRNSSLELADDFDPIIPNQKLIGQFRHGPLGAAQWKKVADSEGNTKLSFDFIMRVEFRYLLSKDGEPQSEEESDEVLAAKIMADFTISYLVNSPELPSDEYIADYAATNAVVQIWPYWREYCQSTMCRMSLPVTTMPVLNVNFKKTDKPKKPPAKSKKVS
jgi:hypothetical protein